MGERGILGEESYSGEWLASTCTDSLPCPSEVSSCEMFSKVFLSAPGSESECLNCAAAPKGCNWFESFLGFFSVDEIKDTELAIKFAIIYIILSPR